MGSPMTTETLHLFDREGDELHVPRGTRLFRRGDRCATVPWLHAGTVRVSRPGMTGRGGTLYVLGAREICALSGLAALCGTRLPADATAEDDVVGRAIPAATFRRLHETDPTVRARLAAALAERFEGLFGLLEAIQFQSIEERLADYLLERARVGPGRPGVGRLITTHERIASDLWTAREVVSRGLKALEHQGVLRIERGAITVFDSDALARRTAAED